MKETGKITAVMVLEIIGRPAKHLVDTLEEIIKEMGEERGVKINNKKINEPVELKDRKDFFTTFAEIEIEVEAASELAMLMFKYMPAHVEVVSPESINQQIMIMGIFLVNLQEGFTNMMKSQG